MNKKTLILNDNTLLKVGKLYKYSGETENLYNIIIWNNTLCKIIKITDEKIHVYESFNNKLYIFSINDVNTFKFKPWWKL